MKTKPGWGSWIAWLLAYTILDVLIDVFLLQGSATWSHIAGSILPAIFTATLTWLFAYRKWLKSDSLY
jgi:Na+-transporting NADH:ubiquinone oxidoreductase subunit NqrB